MKNDKVIKENLANDCYRMDYRNSNASIMYKNIERCIDFIYYNSEDDIHNDNGYAIMYNDEEGEFYINGERYDNESDYKNELFKLNLNKISDDE